MSGELAEQRIETIRNYFRKVDERDPTLLDLFTEDVQFFFPKFGLGHGKAALARFGERLRRELQSLEHDIDGLVFTVSGNRIAVEGQERGVTHEGVRWPDGTISEGRFCNVFEFEGTRISRTHIYVDPDFTNADTRLVRLLRGDVTSATPREVAELYLQRVGAYHADPQTPERLQAVISLFSEEVDWNIAGNRERVPWIGPRRGRAGVAAFFQDLHHHLQPRRFEVRTLLTGEQTVVILGELTSFVKATGKLIESEFAIDITVRDGLITRYRLFEDSHAVAQSA